MGVGKDGGQHHGEYEFDYVYDLKYIVEDAEGIFLKSIFKFDYYITDDNGNIVDDKGNVLVPSDERDDITIQGSDDDVALDAPVGSIPEFAYFTIKPITNLNLSQSYLAYDLNVVVKGERGEVFIQPSGKVLVSINISGLDGNKSYSVYYLNDQGKLEEMVSRIENGKITFETDHFSTYIVMEKVAEEDLKDLVVSEKNDEEVTKPTTPTEPSTDNKTNPITDKSDNKDVIKDTGTVNTGVNENTAFITVVAILSLIGLGLAIKAKKKAVK